MTPRTKLRILLGALVGLSLIPLAQQAKADEPPLPLESVECPPGDRADWRFDPTARRADRYIWVQASPSTFHMMCEDNPNVKITLEACALTYPDPIYGGNYGVIYSRAVPYMYTEAYMSHEICHLKGWIHGTDYSVTVLWSR